MGESVLEVRFEPGEQPARVIQRELAAILAEIQASKEPHEGNTATEDANSASSAPIQGTASETDRGFAGADILVQIFAPVVADALTKLWDDVIWPKLEKRIGKKGVGKRKSLTLREK